MARIRGGSHIRARPHCTLGGDPLRYCALTPTSGDGRVCEIGVVEAAPLPSRRTASFDEEPGFYEPAGLWLYGNARLLRSQLSRVELALGDGRQSLAELNQIELEAEEITLDGGIIVSGVHNPAHQRAAIVPLRWGAPRILVLSGGFRHHLGPDLTEEPFRAARLWRYKWDPRTDLAISRRAPVKLPTFAHCNPTVDRLIRKLVDRLVAGLLFQSEA
jgi:hypothetical protein